MTVKSPIFVIGMGRSGTTLIGETIASHEKLGWFSNYMNKYTSFPEISLVNRVLDLPMIGRYLRGKKNQTKDFHGLIRSYLPYSVEAYPIWKKYCGEKFLWDYLLEQQATPVEKKKMRKLIQKVLLFQGKERFCTKITGPPRITYLKSIFPDACFVHVIRNPKATISSLLNVAFWKNKGGIEKPWWQNGLSKAYIDEWIKYDKSPVALAAVQWKQVVEYAWQESKKLAPGKYMEVHYEQFVKDPQKAIDHIFSRLRLPPSENAYRFINSIAQVKNNMNKKYRQHLSSSEIQLIDEITMATARKAGYIWKI
ncbi:MAG: sulfotransferase [Bacteroidales bacterium]